MSHRSGYMSTAQPTPVTPLRAVVGMLVAMAVALGLYVTIGNSGEEVPAWIALPPGAAVQVSASAPEDQANGAVRYYLRFKAQGEVSTVLAHVTSSMTKATWESVLPRTATRDDLGVRGSWPEWVRKQLHRPPDVSAGRAMIGRAAGDVLHLYAWPTEEACMVEVVLLGAARGEAVTENGRPNEE